MRHDYLLHLATATSAHLGRTDPVEMLKTKLSSIAHVLEYARHTRVRRMLVTSSGAVYGPQPAELGGIPESHLGAPDPLHPASAYGNGKRLVEQMCALTPDVDTVIARCFSFIGPHLPLDARFAAGNFLRDALAGGPIVINGDGTPVRSYLYSADLVIWLLTLLLKGQPNRAYNVGSDRAISLGKLATEVATAGGDVNMEITRASTSDSVAVYVPDIQRARGELGLDVLIPRCDGLRRTIDWANRLS